MPVIVFGAQAPSSSNLQVIPSSFPETKESRLLKADMFTTPFQHKEPGGLRPVLHSLILYSDRFTPNTGRPSNRPAAMPCRLG